MTLSNRATHHLKGLITGLLIVTLSACASKSPDGQPPPPEVAGVYRGTLGDVHIELVLTLDKDAKDSVHGWYVPLDAPPEASKPVLLAGEVDNGVLSLEESHNKVDVSGTWNASISPRALNGSWTSVKGDQELTVLLQRVVGAQIPSMPAP